MKTIQKRIFIACTLLICILCTHARKNDLLKQYPHVTLSNGIVRMSVFLPDPEKGFYRSTRFEWSGMIYELSCGGHSYFLQRNERNPLPLRQDHDPLKSDNAAGLPDQFQDGPERETHEKTAVIIGVGSVDIATGMIVDPGEWKTTSGKTWVEFTHNLKDTNGYAYSYTKRMELTPDKPELVISYSLSNTGVRTISCQQYNHNFFTIDDEYVGKHYELELSFQPEFRTFHPEEFREKQSFLPYATISKNKILLLEDIDVKGGIFSIVEGFGDGVSHHHGIIRNKKTSACVDIRGDLPLSEFHFWADDITFCPEFFVAVSVKSGQTQQWKRVYTFYEE